MSPALLLLCVSPQDGGSQWGRWCVGTMEWWTPVPRKREKSRCLEGGGCGRNIWKSFRHPDNLLSCSQVDGVKQCCLVRFEDNSEFWVLRKDIHSCKENFFSVFVVLFLLSENGFKSLWRSHRDQRSFYSQSLGQLLADVSLSLFASVAAGGEEVCCVCDAPPLKEPLINCFKCRHGKEKFLLTSHGFSQWPWGLVSEGDAEKL